MSAEAWADYVSRKVDHERAVAAVQQVTDYTVAARFGGADRDTMIEYAESIAPEGQTEGLRSIVHAVFNTEIESLERWIQNNPAFIQRMQELTDL